MRRFIKTTILAVAALIGMTAMIAHAQPRTISECSQKLTARGFNIIDKENDDGLYEFEAIKNNQQWDIKMDYKCNVLLERLDD
ncbi:PepSY domain-containing protein [Synechococcus sp. UW179A]|uniref:PepSY domain-containing protein n=1 Tax=Synechococcus sp. UW179A TaxID=2575510 RepID=UPI000E0EC8AF|nr:PepSY domain-containing protein [Synechococcus sp. UW179A]